MGPVTNHSVVMVGPAKLGLWGMIVRDARSGGVCNGVVYNLYCLVGKKSRGEKLSTVQATSNIATQCKTNNATQKQNMSYPTIRHQYQSEEAQGVPEKLIVC